MSDAFVQQFKSQQHVLERLIKGLPGIRGYVDKEARRDADYRVRQLIAAELDKSRNALLDAQNQLLKSGGLMFADDLDVAVSKVQNLADRVRTASYGYAGFFDTVRIGKEELNALYNFDTALLNETAKIETAISALRGALGNKDTISAQIDQVIAAASDLTHLFERRARAIESPELLAQQEYAPAPVALPAADADATRAPDLAAPADAPAPATPVSAAPADAAAPPVAGEQYQLRPSTSGEDDPYRLLPNDL